MKNQKPKRNKAVTVNSKFYPSINEAGRKLKVDPQTISSALKIWRLFSSTKRWSEVSCGVGGGTRLLLIFRREKSKENPDLLPRNSLRKSNLKVFGKIIFRAIWNTSILANRVTENRISKSLPGYRLRAPDEEGRTGG